MFIIRKNDGSIKFAITNDYIMQGSNDVNYVDFAIEGRDNTTWSADCLFGLPGGSTLTLAGVPQDITYSGETYSGYRVWLKSSVTIYAGTLSITARQYDSAGSILYTYPYSQTVNATVLEDDWEAPTTQATYQSFMALITTYLNAFDPHLIRKYNSLALANDQLSSLSLNQVVYVMNTDGNYDYYIKSDATTLTQIHTQEYITLRSEYITAITNAITDGVLTTRLAKNSGATLQAIVDLKNTFYVKSLVYNKTEADNKFLASSELNDYLTIASASETYETKVDSASKLTEAKTYTDNNVDTLNAKDLSQDTAIASAQTKADSAYELASGKANTYIFDTYALMKSALASASSTTYHLGDNLLIKETGVSDYWVSAVNATQSGDYGFYEVSEDEINLEPYQKKIDNALATTDKTIVGGINELNSLKAPISTTQTKTDNTLTTTNKTIAGGINENKASIDTLSDEVISNVGKLQQIDLVGTLASGVITFTTSDTYTLKENCTYELDLHFNVAGNIDLDNTMLCVINGTTINFQNILNNSGTMKVRDMLQVEKYTNGVGYRWIFNAIYNTVSGASFFGIPATISKCDILSLSTSDINAKLQTFDKGQVVQNIDTGLFYIISVDFASETRTLVEMPSQFAKTSALTNGNIIVKTASNYADSGTIKTTFDTKANISDLSTVATSGLYSDLLNKPVFNNVAYSGLYSDLSGVPTISTVGLSGSYNDLLNKPTYAIVATSGKYSDLLNIPTFATVATSGKYTDLNNIPTFATVATSGSYNDLTNKPTIPTKTSELTNDSNYVNKTDYATNSVGGVVKATPISDISSVVEVKIYNGKLYCPSVPTLDVQVVSALPTTGNSGVIYLVPKSGATQDIYSEFIWVNSAWEELGGFEIDLSGYLTIASAQATYEPLINASNKIATTYITGLASVATSGSYNDLTNKPTYATVASSGSYNDLLNLPALKTVATTGSYTDLINKPSLSTVATSGLYSDLVGTPNMSLYLLVSTAQSTYQPLFTSTNKLSASYVSGLASVATSGSYNDLTNKPTLSTVATSGSYNDLTNKPTIISNFYINGTVASNGTITFNSLVVANLISAITNKAIITFVPTNADLEPVKLAYKVASGVYTLLGSYSINNSSVIYNYECMITIVDSVADGSMTIISTQPLLVSGTNIKTINGTSVLGSGNFDLPVYSLPTASTTTLGGVKVDGTTITITNGVIKANYAPYELPIASASVLGGVKIGSNINVSSDGTISVDTPIKVNDLVTTTTTFENIFSNIITMISSYDGVIIGSSKMRISTGAEAYENTTLYDNSVDTAFNDLLNNVVYSFTINSTLYSIIQKDGKIYLNDSEITKIVDLKQTTSVVGYVFYGDFTGKEGSAIVTDLTINGQLTLNVLSKTTLEMNKVEGAKNWYYFNGAIVVPKGV